MGGRHRIESGVWNREILAYYNGTGHTIRSAIDLWYNLLSGESVVFRDVCSGPHCSGTCPEQISLSERKNNTSSVGVKITIAVVVLLIAATCLIMKVYPTRQSLTSLTTHLVGSTASRAQSLWWQQKPFVCMRCLGSILLITSIEIHNNLCIFACALKILHFSPFIFWPSVLGAWSMALVLWLPLKYYCLCHVGLASAVLIPQMYCCMWIRLLHRKQQLFLAQNLSHWDKEMPATPRPRRKVNIKLLPINA